MSVAKKLQVPSGQRLRVINKPQGVKLETVIADDERAEAVLLFVENSRELKALAGPVFTAARDDKLAWIAYPKAGQLNTDLNRDLLWKLVKPEGIRPVRQISIDKVWSALRFRPS